MFFVYLSVILWLLGQKSKFKNRIVLSHRSVHWCNCKVDGKQPWVSHIKHLHPNSFSSSEQPSNAFPAKSVNCASVHFPLCGTCPCMRRSSLPVRSLLRPKDQHKLLGKTIGTNWLPTPYLVAEWYTSANWICFPRPRSSSAKPTTWMPILLCVWVSWGC